MPLDVLAGPGPHVAAAGKKNHHVDAHHMTALAGSNVGLDDLTALGWNETFEKAFRSYENQGLQPARVGVAHNYLYQLYSTKGEVMAELAGKLKHQITQADDLPVVGDWVAVRFDSASSRPRCRPNRHESQTPARKDRSRDPPRAVARRGPPQSHKGR